MSKSVYKKVGIASLIMMASVFLSRLFGFLRLMIIAYVGGRSGEVDAYQVAFVIPEILNHVTASGFLSITFIPIFSIPGRRQGIQRVENFFHHFRLFWDAAAFADGDRDDICA